MKKTYKQQEEIAEAKKVIGKDKWEKLSHSQKLDAIAYLKMKGSVQEINENEYKKGGKVHKQVSLLKC